MSRWIQWGAAWLGALVMSGCVEQTRVEVEIPAHRRGDLQRLEVYVWEGDSGCDGLRAWLRSSCTEDCSLWEPDIADVIQAPVTARRDADGSLSVPALALPAEGSFAVAVRGMTADGAPQEALYGCEVVDTGRAALVRLASPWCRLDVCEALYHPACGGERDCSMIAGDLGEIDPANPPCRPTLARDDGTAAVWQEAGVSCDPIESVGLTDYPEGSPCRPGILTCEPGVFTPTGGVCPAAGADECAKLEGRTGYHPDADLDCNGTHPHCDSGGPACTSDSIGARHCPTADCLLVCLDGGWTECSTPHFEELCDGRANTCDGLTEDELLDTQFLRPDGRINVDNPLLRSCNPGRELDETQPRIVAHCKPDGTCGCGTGAACADGEICCPTTGGPACVSRLTDANNCGFCGNVCPVGEVCSAGACTSEDVPVAECVEVDDCNDADLEDPRSDQCLGGECFCAEDPGCHGGNERCCPADASDSLGKCVDIGASSQHCGRCGNECADGMHCVSGTCLRVTAEPV